MKRANLSKWNGKVVEFKHDKIISHPANHSHNLMECIGISFIDKGDIANYNNSNHVNVMFIDNRQEIIDHFRFQIRFLKKSRKAVPYDLKDQVIATVNDYHHGRFDYVGNLEFLEFMTNIKKVKAK